MRRRLEWEGCVNVRDLGGLQVAGGGQVRRGALIRSDHPSKLTGHGWDALVAYGIRTVIELGTEGSQTSHTDRAQRPDCLTTYAIDIEDLADLEFVERWARTGLWGTPFYFSDALERWPQRHAEVVSTFATAPHGGVLVHCARGHDRTGIICLLLLSLAGVGGAAIAEDYAMSDLYMEAEDRARLRQCLASRNTSSEQVIIDLLTGFDAVSYLRQAGLAEATIDAARRRLVGG